MKVLLMIFNCLWFSTSYFEIKAQNNINKVIMKELTREEKQVIENKGTEIQFTGKYNDYTEKGTYTCKRCGTALYRSEDKFNSNCGWPSFDDEIKGAVKQLPDSDGLRIEILCSKCDAHLGHIFTGEGLTLKNTRHCVNSISMDFIPSMERAIFAGGCFWGVEHLMQQQKGVISVESGYIGGDIENPTYEQICTKTTGHAEAVEIVYNPLLVDYETLTKLFFEIHDSTQANGQGPDIGPQYRSEIFYLSPEQKIIANKVVAELISKGYNATTKITVATKFYKAEKYHQDYYDNKGTEPYCHSRVRIF